MPALLEQPPCKPSHTPSQPPPPAPPHVQTGRDAAILKAILLPHINLAIWQRQPVAAARPAVGALANSAGALAITWVQPGLEDLRATLSQAAPHVREDAVSALAVDILALTKIFRGLLRGKAVRVRLDTLHDNGCALFHMDTLALRMLCTYSGPGTQWLSEDNLRRDQLGLRGRSIEDANHAIVKNHAAIHTAASWHVLAFKGRLNQHPGAVPGLVHRSAPLQGSGLTRVRLTLDAADACAC